MTRPAARWPPSPTTAYCSPLTTTTRAPGRIASTSYGNGTTGTVGYDTLGRQNSLVFTNTSSSAFVGGDQTSDSLAGRVTSEQEDITGTGLSNPNPAGVTVGIAGLDRALSQALEPWRRPNARHDPAKIITDLALSLAVGGDCLADVAVLRDQPGVFGPVASDPTVSRLVDALAVDATKALAAIDAARAATRARAWSLAGKHAPNHAASVDDPMIVDLDATLLTAHSDKEQPVPAMRFIRSLSR